MTELTTRIKCDGCSRNLLQVRFSDSSKKKYWESVSANRRNPKTPVRQPRCFGCNPQNKNEMRCIMCDQTMDLEQFSKAQRRKPDDAHCRHCQQEKEDREADHSKEVEEIQIIDDLMRRSRLESTNSYYSAAGSGLHQSRLSRSHSNRIETDTNPGSNSWVDGNDAISVAGTETSSSSSTSTRIITGSGWDGFAGDGRASTSRSVVSGRSNNPGFVKQNAVAKDADQKAREQIARDNARRQQQEEQVERDEADEDSEADDDPY